VNLPLVVRIDAEDTRSAEQLKLDGWREIEVLEAWTGVVWADNEIPRLGRRATVDDIQPCVDLAKRAFIHDRLHRDMELPAGVADAAKEEWVRKAFQTTEWQVWVADWMGIIGAFLIIKQWRNEDKNFGALIDLIAVAPEFAGQRIGTRLIRTALNYVNEGYMFLRAGTQSCNREAQRLYSSLGLQPAPRRLRTFHKSRT